MISWTAMLPCELIQQVYWRWCWNQTYISQLLNWNVNQLCHLLITSKYLSCSSPAASGDGHAGKDPIVFHQAFIKPHLNAYKFYIRERLHSLSEFRSEFV